MLRLPERGGRSGQWATLKEGRVGLLARPLNRCQGNTTLSDSLTVAGGALDADELGLKKV